MICEALSSNGEYNTIKVIEQIIGAKDMLKIFGKKESGALLPDNYRIVVANAIIRCQPSL